MIHDHQDCFDISLMCELLEVNRRVTTTGATAAPQ